MFTTSLLIRRPLPGIVGARITGRDGGWRRIRQVCFAFHIATAVMATSWSQFLVQFYLSDTDQDGSLALARMRIPISPVLVSDSEVRYSSVPVISRTRSRCAGRLSRCSRAPACAAF